MFHEYASKEGFTKAIDCAKVNADDENRLNKKIIIPILVVLI